MEVETRGQKRRRPSLGDIGAFTKKGRQSAQLQPALKKAIVKQIHAESEMKYFTLFLTNTAIPIVQTTMNNVPILFTGGTAQFGIFSPPTGSLATTRTANSVYLHKIRIKSNIGSVAVATAAARCLVRYMLVRDKESIIGATAPTLADVLDNTGNAAQVNMSAFQQIGNMGRFDVLIDKTIELNPPSGTQGVAKSIKEKVFFKNPLKIRFNSTTAEAVTDKFQFFIFAGDVDCTPQHATQTRCYFKED